MLKTFRKRDAVSRSIVLHSSAAWQNTKGTFIAFASRKARRGIHLVDSHSLRMNVIVCSATQKFGKRNTGKHPCRNLFKFRHLLPPSVHPLSRLQQKAVYVSASPFPPPSIRSSDRNNKWSKRFACIPDDRECKSLRAELAPLFSFSNFSIEMIARGTTTKQNRPPRQSLPIH